MIEVIRTPRPYDFSNNRASIEFQCSDYNITDPVKSVNAVQLLMAPIDKVFTLKYGSKEITLTAVLDPDNSGTQIPAISPSFSAIFANLALNFDLSTDFTFQNSGLDNFVVFTARETGPEYDIENYNETPGSKQVVIPDYGIHVRINCQNADHSADETIYDQRIPLLDISTGRIRVQVSDKIHDYLTRHIRELNPDIPEGNFIECKKSCRRYSVYYYEVKNGVPEPRQSVSGLVAIHGGMSNRAQMTNNIEAVLQPGATAATDRFLKQGPRMVFTRPEQPQFLYFFNTRESVPGAKLKIRQVFTDGSQSDFVMKTFTMDALKKYAFNVTFESFYTPHEGKTVDHYHVWISGSSGNSLSETRTFYIDRSLKKYIRYFLSWSSFGSMDSRVCFGEGSTELQVTQSVAELVIRDQQSVSRGSAMAFDLRAQSNFSVSTGFMPSAEMLLWRDFYLSLFKYRLTKGVLMPILLMTDRLREVQDGSKLLAHTFEYRYLYDDQDYTEGDIEDGGSYYKNMLFYNQSAPEGSFTNESGKTLLSEQQYFIKD